MILEILKWIPIKHWIFCTLDIESFALKPNENFLLNLCPWGIKGFTIDQLSHFYVVLEEPYVPSIPLEARISQSFYAKMRDWG